LSALTHPVIFFVFPAYFPADYWAYVSAAEAFAVGVETLMLRVLGVPNALVWAGLANGASLAVALLSRGLWGWP